MSPLLHVLSSCKLCSLISDHSLSSLFGPVFSPAFQGHSGIPLELSKVCDLKVSNSIWDLFINVFRILVTHSHCYPYYQMYTCQCTSFQPLIYFPELLPTTAGFLLPSWWMWERGRLSYWMILSSQIIHLGRREKWVDCLADAGRETAADQMVVSNHSVTITAVEQQIMVTQFQMQKLCFYS